MKNKRKTCEVTQLRHLMLLNYLNVQVVEYLLLSLHWGR